MILICYELLYMLPCRLSETKKSNLEYWKPAMMIGLETVILEGTGLLTKSQPVTTGRASTKTQKNG